MRVIPAILSILALSTYSALAASAETVGPLVPGKPAGVKEANMHTPSFVLVAGIAVVAAGIAIVASSGNNNNVSTSTTGTAP